MSQVFNAYVASLAEDTTPDIDADFVVTRDTSAATSKKVKPRNFLSLYAPLASPAFSGNPTVPTQSPGTNNTRAASTAYVDTAIAAAVAGLKWKNSVRVATATAGTLASSFENGDTVDGVVLATGDRILIKDQATATENGIYVVAASGAPSRSTDADSGSELVNAAVFVEQGTANADKLFVCTNNQTPTLGVTNITFSQFSAGGGITNSAGNNVVTKSDGTNLVASQITDNGTTVQIGTNAASAGILGIPNNTAIKARNAANSADVTMISVNASDQVEFAGATFKITDSGSVFLFESKTGADGEKAYLGKGHYAGAYLSSSDGHVTLGAQFGGVVVHSLYSGSDAVVRMRAGSTSQPILRVHADGASHAADMQQWSDDTNATNVYSRINKAGYFITKKNSAPADGDIGTSELAIWFDNTSGAAKIKFKGKDSGGTVRTGEVALT